MPGKRQQGMSAYIAVTAAYWAFMLSDGALRMLVLLHFHTLGFSPVQLAYLFLLYELMGIVTNLSAGWLAARFGLTSTLYTGLILQIAALITLTQMNPDWPPVTSVLFVMAVQGLSGIAKDLAKMSSKSAVKLLAPSDDQGALFRWVALLTGSKNAVKGFGFLLGAALLGLVGFDPAMLGMAAALGLVLILIVMTMPSGLPGGTKGIKFCDVFSKNQNINRLSAARLFLFGARDTWFVVGIPIYFYAVLSDGTPNGDRAAFFQVGTFMAAWIIGYGIVQAAAPKLLRARSKGIAEIVGLARNWVAVLTLIPATLAVAVWSFPVASMGLTVTIVFWAFAFRCNLRRQFIDPFVPDSGLQRSRACHHGCRLLLHVERRRTPGRNAAVRPQLPGGRTAGVSCNRRRHVVHQLVLRIQTGQGTCWLRTRKDVMHANFSNS